MNNEEFFYTAIGFAALSVIFNIMLWCKMSRNFDVVEKRLTLCENRNRFSVELPQDATISLTSIKTPLIADKDHLKKFEV